MKKKKSLIAEVTCMLITIICTYGLAPALTTESELWTTLYFTKWSLVAIVLCCIAGKMIYTLFRGEKTFPAGLVIIVLELFFILLCIPVYTEEEIPSISFLLQGQYKLICGVIAIIIGACLYLLRLAGIKNTERAAAKAEEARIKAEEQRAREQEAREQAQYEEQVNQYYRARKAQEEANRRYEQSHGASGGASQTAGSGTSYFEGCTTAEQLRKRYRDLCKVYHPDMGNGSEEVFNQIQKEYEQLKQQVSQ